MKPNGMSLDQAECYELFADLVGGEHHICGGVKLHGRGLLWNMRNSRLGSFDFDGLTRLVLLAHDRCIRVEVQPSGPGLVGLTAFKRHTREGAMHERHPTMEEHITMLRPKQAPQSEGERGQ